MKIKKIIICLLITIIGAICTMTSAFAEDSEPTTETSSVKSINFDNTIKKGDVFYYGAYTSGETQYDVPWVAMNDDGYVFSKYLLGKSWFNDEYGMYFYANDENGNDYDSLLKRVMEGFYSGDNTLFTDNERSAIKQTTLSAESMDESSSRGRKDIDAYVFPMSAWCDYNSSTNLYTYYGDFNTIYSDETLQQYLKSSLITNKDGDCEDYWFRTGQSGKYTTAQSNNVYSPNIYSYVYVGDQWKLTNGSSVRWSNGEGVRPAFTLDTTKILYKSDAKDGKVSGSGKNALTAVGESSSDEWKLTFLDDTRNFSASVDSTKTNVGLGNPVTVTYSGAKTGNNEYISAMILDTDGNILYYGQVDKSSESGTAKVYIPQSLGVGSYTLRVFNEQANGDYKTDYSSSFVDIAITTYEDTTSPTGVINLYKGQNEIKYGDGSTEFNDTIDMKDYPTYNKATIRINATDDSDDVKIEYFVGERYYTIEELESVDFSVYTNPIVFADESNGKQLALYARLTDSVGHITYLNFWEYIYVDTEAPVISGVENGKTYCGKQTITITDIGLSLVETNNQSNSINVNKDEPYTIEINPSTMEQEILAYDSAGNVTTYCITVNDGHTAEDDDGDCTTNINCSVCGELVTKGYDAHEFVKDESYTGIGTQYVCSHSGCTVSKIYYNISNENDDSNITIDKSSALSGDTVTLSYTKGYNPTWTVVEPSGNIINVVVDETNSSKATFIMPSNPVAVVATATIKEFNIQVNYVNDSGDMVSDTATVEYNSEYILNTNSILTINNNNMEFCCWQVKYGNKTYDLKTFEKSNAAGDGVDTAFKVAFDDESITYIVQAHYLLRVEPSFAIPEIYAGENPSSLIEEIHDYYFGIEEKDIIWCIGTYDGTDELVEINSAYTFVEGNTYTVFIWINLHGEYLSIKKSSEGGSLGYVNPIINGEESSWIFIEDNYIGTYHTFTAKKAKVNLEIASGAAYYDSDGNKISTISSTSTSSTIKASTGDKIYLKLTANPNTGYELDTWVVSVGDVVVNQDEKGYYIIVGEQTTFISPTFKKSQYKVEIDIAGKITTQYVEYQTKVDLSVDGKLPEGQAFYCWLYEDNDDCYIEWDALGGSVSITKSCKYTACYGIPVTPEYYIKTPIVGETPSYDVHAKYEGTLGKDPYNNGLSVEWLKYDTTTNNWTKVDNAYTFEENTQYKAYLCVNLLTSGYTWATLDDGSFVEILLNGNVTKYDSNSDGIEWVYTIFDNLKTSRYDISSTTANVLVNTFTSSEALENEIISITPKEVVGKAFVSWVITGVTDELDLTKEELTFHMPSNNISVEATYKDIDYAITITNGTSTHQTANYKDSVTITADSPKKGKEFDKWIIEGIDTTGIDLTNPELTIEMPSNNMVIEATYKTIKKSNSGYIIGGVLGAILLIALVTAGIVIIKKKSKKYN